MFCNLLFYRLHKNKGNLTKETVTHEKLYATLSDCMIDRIEIQNVNLSTYNMSQPTTDQEELLNRVGLNDLLSHDVIKKIRSSS